MIEASERATSGWVAGMGRGRRVALGIALLILALSALLAAVVLITHSVSPLGEARLLSIAHDSWRQGDWFALRPHGATISVDPLWLWLVQAGWLALGASELWPRLLSAGLGLANVAVAVQLTLLLWPSQREAARHVPLLLLSSVPWLLFTTLAGDGLLLALWVEAGWIALLLAGRKRDGRAWLLLAGAFAGGLLTAGPAILLYLGPPALLAPLWIPRKPRMHWGHWYADVAKALSLAALVLLAWLGPVALGPERELALAWLMARPAPPPDLVYPGAWQALVLLLLFLPWSLWLRGWRRIGTSPELAGVLSFVACALVPTLALLALAPGRPALLLPLVLLLASVIAPAVRSTAWLARIAVFSVLLTALAFASLNRWNDGEYLAQLSARLSQGEGVVR
jgi:hypothetical protein